MSKKDKSSKIQPRGLSWVWEYKLQELRTLWRQELTINKNRLEMASLEQATVFEKWYNALEEVEADIKDEERRLTGWKSKLQLKLRAINPEWKEAHFTAAIDATAKTKKFVRRIALMNRYRGALKGAVEGARQRKSMIGVMKDLYVSNYWDKTTPGGTPLHGRKDQRKKRQRNDD